MQRPFVVAVLNGRRGFLSVLVGTLRCRPVARITEHVTEANVDIVCPFGRRGAKSLKQDEEERLAALNDHGCAILRRCRMLKAC